MRVHHLNCGTMDTPGVDIVCHILVIETDNGLALVDTGFGLHDCATPSRLGPIRHLLRPRLDPDESAARQIERLGFRVEDVRHIITTHFDIDHISGLADFPDAQVHVTSAEWRGATTPILRERPRFRPVQWQHGPKLVTYEPGGEAWRGFAAAQELDAIAPGIVLVPLPGHSVGHACVAVDAGHRWVLHCGDAFYYRGTIDGTTHVPAGMVLAESFMAYDKQQVRDNHARLAELYLRGDPDLLIVSSHDPALFADAIASDGKR